MSNNFETDWIWFNGKYVPFADAKIHVLSHVVHYGSAVFEGQRCYKTKKGPAIFRLKDHTRRLFNSAKIYRIVIPYTQDEINNACKDIIRKNNLEESYMRPIVFRGYGALGVNPFPCPIDVVIACLRWGKYLGEEALLKGVDVRVSSWNRMAPNTFPGLAKAAANYMNSQLIKMEALVDNYVEGIALDCSGYVSEGSGENIFVVYDGVIYTPPLHNTVLPGITRDSVIKLARDMNIAVKEETIPREMLYIADEVFFTGSAAEITPVRSIDKIIIGKGEAGLITKKLQKHFFAILTGDAEDPYGWLEYC